MQLLLGLSERATIESGRDCDKLEFTCPIYGAADTPDHCSNVAMKPDLLFLNKAKKLDF